MFSNSQTNVLGISSQSVLFVTVILMWIGVRSLLRYIIILFIACSFFFISKVNEAMGFYGSFYIIFSFASFVLQIYTNILPEISFEEKEFLGEKISDIIDNNYNPF